MKHLKEPNGHVAWLEIRQRNDSLKLDEEKALCESYLPRDCAAMVADLGQLSGVPYVLGKGVNCESVVHCGSCWTGLRLVLPWEHRLADNACLHKSGRKVSAAILHQIE